MRVGKWLSGCVIVLAGIVPFAAASAGTLVMLHSFSALDGMYYPTTGVAADQAGNLYGTTYDTGGIGHIFRLGTNGTLNAVHAFKGGRDGAYPSGQLVIDKAGNLYGVTASGGQAGCGQTGSGCGTVFKIKPNGRKVVLHSFAGGSDGSGPMAGLVRDKAGNLYGTTVTGGNAGCFVQGCGIVFRIAPQGTETVLHRFQGGDDGAGPMANLTFDAAGNLYGTTAGGGNTEGHVNSGTVFKLAPDGTATILHGFDLTSEGGAPSAGVVFDKLGNLYGTTQAGGAHSDGTVFKLAPDGNLTVLYDFEAFHDGAWPNGYLDIDQRGRWLYGATNDTGSFETIFRVSTVGKGKEQVLYQTLDEPGQPRGFFGGLLRDRAGHLFGTAFFGGDQDLGMVFEFIP